MNALERAKQAWLELSLNERDEFQGFLTSQEAASSTLRLTKGTGKRACYNGRLGTLVAGSQRSGWVDVQLSDAPRMLPLPQGGALHTGAGQVSWRSGAWKVVAAPQALNLIEGTREGTCRAAAAAALVPADALALVLGHCSLRQRLRALPTCSDWASLAADPAVWSRLCTPLVAGAFTADRLTMLLHRAGAGLQVLDVHPHESQPPGLPC